MSDTNSSQIEQTQEQRVCVCVLLASYNGLRWLPEQVDSILNQSGVVVKLIVSDDMSTDGTWAWLQNSALTEPRVTILPRGDKYGSAAANFYRLIIDADLSRCEYVAFADQDDIWNPDKLIKHVSLANQGKYDGISSSVTAFWPDGRTVIIDKSQPQRELDYLFSSPGPGCTFLMSPWLIGELRRILLDPATVANKIALHDWLTYAVCRASKRTWYIDKTPSVQYRQHHANEFGANHGFSAALSRLNKFKTGWYRAEILKVLKVCMMLSPRPEYADITRHILRNDIISRLSLLRYINKARRRCIDRLVLALAIVLSIL